MEQPLVPSTAMTAKAIVRNHDGNYLVLRSSKWEERPDRSQKPDLPGGMVEVGEPPQAAVAREVMEEAGIQINPEQYKLVYSETEYFDDTATSLIKHIYFVQTETTDVTLSWEHEAFEWLTEADFLKTEWRPFYSRANEYLFSKNLLT